jgi:hypothetical protein
MPLTVLHVPPIFPPFGASIIFLKSTNYETPVGFEILTAVTVKSPLKDN